MNPNKTLRAKLLKLLGLKTQKIAICENGRTKTRTIVFVG